MQHRLLLTEHYLLNLKLINIFELISIVQLMRTDPYNKTIDLETFHLMRYGARIPK
jgi:hypothetical protein